MLCPGEMDTNPGDSDPGNLKADQYSTGKRQKEIEEREREGGGDSEKERERENNVDVIPTTLMISHLMFKTVQHEIPRLFVRICTAIVVTII